MTNRLSVASVTLAHNSEQLLPRQLDALLRQSRPLEEIIVVNNGSIDGTRDLLSTRYPQVTVLDLQANVGAGAGYAAGLAYAATKKKHDWVWLLDHDSIPMAQGVEKLLQELAEIDDSASVGILASRPIHSETQLSYPGMLWRRGWVRPSSDWLD